MIRTRQGATTVHVLLAVIAVLLLLNLVHGLSQPAQAEDGKYGRYAIGAFAFSEDDGDCYSGYYLVDTETGSVSHYRTFE
jgi:hypothetical protein